MQKKINERINLDFTGQINLIENDYAFDGKIKSEFLNLDELLKLISNFQN